MKGKIVSLIETVTTTKFVVDGNEFETREAAEKYIGKLALRRDSAINSYTTRKHKHLMGIHVWRIEDEGPVDFSSSARPVVIGYVRGTFDQAIDYAMGLERFWGYGPGNIEPITIVDANVPTVLK